MSKLINALGNVVFWVIESIVIVTLALIIAFMFRYVDNKPVVVESIPPHLEGGEEKV